MKTLEGVINMACEIIIQTTPWLIRVSRAMSNLISISLVFNGMAI